MNTDTGQIYRGDAEIREARQRGEPVVPVSERVANLIEHAQVLEGHAKEGRRRAWRQRWLTPAQARS